MSRVTPSFHVLPVNDFFFHQPIYLTDSGVEIRTPGDPYAFNRTTSPVYNFEFREGRRLPHFCLALVLAGSGEVETNHQQKVRAGDAFFYRPDEWHRHRPSLKTGWTMMWVGFNGATPIHWMDDGLFNLQGNKPAIENKALFRAQFEHLTRNIDRNPTNNSLNYSHQIVGLLSHFLLDPPFQADIGLKDAHDEVVNAAIDYIWNFNHDLMDVPTVARKAGVARRTLDRRFKAVMGHSVLEEIQKCRIHRATILLRQTTMPIKQVAQRAGFHNTVNLHLVLKKAFGLSASAYRNQLASET